MADKKSKKSAPRSGGAAATAGKASSGSPMDVGLLEQMIRLMAENDLNTVDVRDGARRVILKRGQAVAAYPAGAMFAGPAPAAAPPAAAARPDVGPGLAGGTPSQADDANLVPITSPMPGTFYSAAKPGEKPFVAVGSVVNEESDVCIIEAMKTFNTHKAGVSGTIAKVLVQNGQTVQFDQPLFLVRPS